MMGKKVVRIPFNLELAKKIMNGEIEGRIIRNDGANVRIVSWNCISMSEKYPLACLVENGISEQSELYTNDGKYKSWEDKDIRNREDLSIEITSFVKIQFKPFDKVLVRQSETCKWEASFFSNITDEVHRYRCCGMNYMFCIPYDENTAHLIGTTDNWEC